MTARYELGTAPPARRALAERLPVEVAIAAAEFITGPLLDDPRRVGKPLGAELAGIYSARLGRDWRVLYEIDEAKPRGNQAAGRRGGPVGGQRQGRAGAAEAV